MKKHLVQLVINPLTVIYIALSLFLGRFSFVVGLFIITIIHELFHMFSALIFRIPTSKITISPLGCYANIDELEDAKRYEQIIVLLAGPLSYFFSSAIITFLYRYDFISIYRYEELFDTNLLVMFFNLLPIEPLDGGKILKIIFSSMLDEKNSIKINSIFGFIFGLFTIYYLWKVRQYLFAIFILCYIITNIFNQKRKYRQYLYHRLISNIGQSLPIKINTSNKFYRFANNYYLSNSQIISERKYLNILLKNTKHHGFLQK